MMNTPRARQIIKLVADHVAADPRCKWVVHWHTRHPADWSIWLVCPGYPLFEFDHWWGVRT